MAVDTVMTNRHVYIYTYIYALLVSSLVLRGITFLFTFGVIRKEINRTECLTTTEKCVCNAKLHRPMETLAFSTYTFVKNLSKADIM